MSIKHSLIQQVSTEQVLCTRHGFSARDSDEKNKVSASLKKANMTRVEQVKKTGGGIREQGRSPVGQSCLDFVSVREATRTVVFSLFRIIII